jgi:formyl-CoA transferase
VSVSERLRHADELERLIEEVLSAEDTSHWAAKLDQSGIPGGPINTHDQALADPHVIAREMVLEVEHPKAGRTKTVGMPAKMNGTPGRIRFPAPLLGQHTDEVLLDRLGLKADEIAHLREGRVV